MSLHELMGQVLSNSWRAGILIAVLFAAGGLPRRFVNARVFHWFWVVVAVRFLLPFDLPAPIHVTRYIPAAPFHVAQYIPAAPQNHAAGDRPSVAGITPAASSTGAASPVHPPWSILFNEKTLTTVWLGGVAAVLLAYLGAGLSFRRQLARHGRPAGERTKQMVSDCSRAIGLNPIPVFEMETIPGPALFGIWRPRILFPEGLTAQLTDEELRLVILHELGHCKRLDLLLQGLLVVSKAIHWFNPLAWLAGRLARADRELACDEFVMAHTSNPGDMAYAKTLLRMQGLSRPGRFMLLAVGILETKNRLKQRILMIQNYKSTSALRFVLGAAAILTVSAGLLMAHEMPEESQTIDLGGGVTMEFVLIRPGSFQIGDEKYPPDKYYRYNGGEEGMPAHKVTITKPFYFGKYLVTQEQWKRIMGSNPSHFKGAKNPVDSVNWEDCQTFLRKLKEKLPSQTFRLPTEAEWEYACRAGSSTNFFFGDSDEPMNEYSWSPNPKDGNNPWATHPVGEKKPNRWGLYDVYGLVLEWCSDWYGPYTKSDQTDPPGPASDEKHGHVTRGWHFKSSGRGFQPPGGAFSGNGLRCVLVAD